MVFQTKFVQTLYCCTIFRKWFSITNSK